MKFLTGLVGAIERCGGVIHGGMHVRQLEDVNGSIVVHCGNGARVKAQSVVVATNTPINDIVTIHTKQHAYRTYALALRATRDTPNRALYWDTSQTAGDHDGP